MLSRFSRVSRASSRFLKTKYNPVPMARFCSGIVDAPVSTESVSGAAEKHTFQAETRRLLDIVAKSLYTDKEIFVRELISNASDACEKVRYRQSSNQSVVGEDVPLQIQLTTDEERGIMTIRDTGIGMTKEELILNLGTIAHSGSKQFVNSVEQGASGDGIIGQFGVGFYSVFMVADKVEVYSQSATGGKAHYWSSTGDGSYEISEAENVERGTKIILHLRNDCKNFAKRKTIQRISKKHSSFVSFPIMVDDTELSSLGAIWLKSSSEITEEQHAQFYKFISQGYDTPPYRLHFHSDVPLSIHALFYFPERHLEKYGLGRLDPGVNLYSRKVLIQAKSESILPGWLRFVKGVVDSEDIPLNISRENMQDTSLIARIRKVLTRKIIRHLEEISVEDPEKYYDWYKEFGMFIREGVATDLENRNEVARLLRYESSAVEGPTSLDAYISRMPPSQKNIYYLYAPSREQAKESPYLEAFKENNIEVFFVYGQVDEMVIQSLRQFENRDIKCAEAEDVEVNRKDESINEVESGELSKWIESVLKENVKSVSPAKRAISSPAIVIDQDSSSSRRMLSMMDMGGEEMPLAAQKLEINMKHPIMRGLLTMRTTNEPLASKIAEQVYDNALISAGLLHEPRSMVGRINSILEVAINSGLQQDVPKPSEPVAESTTQSS